MTGGNTKILLIGFGNPARADDGLGPALAEEIESKNIPDVTVETDYQLTIEDSTQVAKHDIVIFADASVNCAEPFTFQAVKEKKTNSFSGHSVEPAEVMALAENLFKSKAKGYVLGIRGYEFEQFEEKLTKKAKINLQKAAEFLETMLKTKNFNKIQQTSACF
jgi:hydrogenase maturation protease